MSEKLPPDATLHDLRSSTRERETFARKVLGVMHAIGKNHGQVVFRMGVTGTGQLPNYRIEDADGKVIVAMDGNNHRRWPDDANVNAAATWSTAAMSRTDVENVIAMLTGYQGGDRPAK